MKAVHTVYSYLINIPKSLQIGLKILVSLLALAYIVYRIRQEPQAFDFFAQSFSVYHICALVLAFLLIAANLGVEALKWQKIMRIFYPQLPFATAAKAIFAGNTAGIFTPNRLGEYPARVMYLPSGKRVEALMLTLIDRMCQMLITMWTGMFACSYFLYRFEALLSDYFHFNHLGIIEILAWIWVVTVSLGVIFAKEWIKWIPESWLTWEIAKKMKQAVLHTERKMLAYILSLSLLRNLIFTFQYYLLLVAFGYQESLLLAFALTSSVFLLKSIVPSISFSELGIRESVAITVMGAFGVSVTTAASSTFLLYLYNIAFPALIGIIFLNKQSS